MPPRSRRTRRGGGRRPVHPLAGGPGLPDAMVARRLGADAWAPDADQLDALLSDSG